MNVDPTKYNNFSIYPAYKSMESPRSENNLNIIFQANISESFMVPTYNVGIPKPVKVEDASSIKVEYAKPINVKYAKVDNNIKVQNAPDLQADAADKPSIAGLISR